MERRNCCTGCAGTNNIFSCSNRRLQTVLVPMKKDAVEVKLERVKNEDDAKSIVFGTVGISTPKVEANAPVSVKKEETV